MRILASDIYNAELLNRHSQFIDDCHIYMIGNRPELSFVRVESSPTRDVFTLNYRNSEYEFSRRPLAWDHEGKSRTAEDLVRNFPDCIPIPLDRFNVLYIGQAFGKNGGRTALDRLKRHETLQKIALSENIPEHDLTILLIRVADTFHRYTDITDDARELWADHGFTGRAITTATMNVSIPSARRGMIALFEAALINYFKPAHNENFTRNFYTSNLKKVVRSNPFESDCSVFEFNTHKIGFQLFSQSVTPQEEVLFERPICLTAATGGEVEGLKIKARPDV